MPLTLNEIREPALVFAKEWEDESSEDAEAKSFWYGGVAPTKLDKRLGLLTAQR
jgi:hypothetical protein